jgi:hypothetical protein
VQVTAALRALVPWLGSTLEQGWNEAANRWHFGYSGGGGTDREEIEMAARADVWAQVRAAYEGGANLSELARSSGLSRTAIRTRARLEGWTRSDLDQEPLPCPAGARTGERTQFTLPWTAFLMSGMQ